MNAKRAREGERESARKKSNYIYPRQKCVFEYSVCVCMRKLVSFLYVHAFNSICNVLLVYDMSHEKNSNSTHTHTKELHSIRTFEWRRAVERKRTEEKGALTRVVAKQRFRCVRNHLNNYNLTCTISFAFAIATLDMKASWRAVWCARRWRVSSNKSNHGKRVNRTKPTLNKSEMRSRALSFSRSDSI